MKLRYLSVALVAGSLLFAACDEDRDSNPSMNGEEEYASFVLNTPGVAANNTYDLQNSESLVLTTSQPNYGFTASTVYTVWVSLNGEDYTALSTTYTTAQMAVSASEINSAILDMAGDMDLTAPITLYVKLTANIYGQEIGQSESNSIELKNVQAYVPVVEVTLPTELYIVGSFAASDGWNTFVPLHQGYSQDGFFYGIVYMAEGDEFKINPDAGWKSRDMGYGQLTSESDFLVSAGDDASSNIKCTKAGWYNVICKAKIANGSLQYTLQLIDAKVYVVGACNGGEWSMLDDFLFTAPADASGEWVSPAFAAGGEVRMAIDCGIDWWKTEFTLYNGEIFYRNCDIPNNWNDDLGADYSVTGNAGGHVYLDFTKGTGSYKD